MRPIPGMKATTRYGIRGPHWSCRRNAAGEGIHTGVDFAAPRGTRVYAARGGVARWVNHGAAFGNHQLEVQVGGTRDFYAHLEYRQVDTGTVVRAGDYLGDVGAEGNVTGPHLHFERHSVGSGPWACATVVWPWRSLWAWVR